MPSHPILPANGVEISSSPLDLGDDDGSAEVQDVTLAGVDPNTGDATRVSTIAGGVVGRSAIMTIDGLFLSTGGGAYAVDDALAYAAGDQIGEPILISTFDPSFAFRSAKVAVADVEGLIADGLIDAWLVAGTAGPTPPTLPGDHAEFDLDIGSVMALHRPIVIDTDLPSVKVGFGQFDMSPPMSFGQPLYLVLVAAGTVGPWTGATVFVGGTFEFVPFA